jgi:hypothetical protein
MNVDKPMQYGKLEHLFTHKSNTYPFMPPAVDILFIKTFDNCCTILLYIMNT